MEKGEWVVNIVVSAHHVYNYMDATIIQGLQNLGHSVCPRYGIGSNYVKSNLLKVKSTDLFIQFLRDGDPCPSMHSIMIWGEDECFGLKAQMDKGFTHVFVRDRVVGMPGYTINFAIEDRYYCVTETSIKPLQQREIDVCFLGQTHCWKRKEYIDRIKEDFPGLNLMLGNRQFNAPDKVWSKHTLPWAAHDVRYFETLSNSKICLSLYGAGPDTGRFWENLASGAVCIAEADLLVDIVRPLPAGVRWFYDYEHLKRLIKSTLDNLDRYQESQIINWETNKVNHSAAARAQYVLDTIKET